MSDRTMESSKIPTTSSLADLFFLLLSNTGATSKVDVTSFLQVKTRFYSGDLNECKETGIYRLNPSGTNWPIPSAAGMIMLNLMGTYQLVFRAGEGGHIYYRANSDANGWGVWKTVV